MKYVGWILVIVSILALAGVTFGVIPSLANVVWGGLIFVGTWVAIKHKGRS